MESSARLPVTPAPPLWRRALPWALAIVFCALIFARADRAGLARACSHVNFPLYALFIAVLCSANLLADVFATSLAYKLTVAPVEYWTMVKVRAASYIPSLVNFHVGQAYLTYVLSNVYGAPLLRVAAGTLVVYVTSIGAIVVLAALSLPFSLHELPAFAWPIAAVTALGVVYLAVLAIKPAFLAKQKLLAPLFDVGALGHIQILAARMPHMFVVAGGLWGSFWFFGIKLSLVASLTYLPILMLVTVLPITPAGIGTRDAVAITLLHAYVSSDEHEATALIAGAGILQAVCSLVMCAIIGLAFTRPAARVLARASSR